MLLGAASQTALIHNERGRLLISELLFLSNYNAEMVAALLEDAVGIADDDGMLPIHYAALNDG